MSPSLTRLDSLLQNTLKNLKLEETFKVHPIWKNWGSIVGAAVASRAQPEYVQNDTLYIEVANSVWANELEMQKKSLIKKINDRNFGFALKEIRFRVKRD